jgi:diguanylate cyclase (GGDEF)-like protein
VDFSVLLVGGSESLRASVVRALPAMGVQCAATDQAAFVLRHTAFTAVALLHPEAMSLLHALQPAAPVVVVAPDNEELANAYLKLGVEDYVTDVEVDIAGYLARALRRAVMRRAAKTHLERAARIDPLTELLNRRGLDEVLARLGDRSPHTVGLLVDLDDFKAINTERGHSGGDEVLRGVANALLAGCRPTDFVARIGGDEFMVVLPGADVAAGLEVAERLRSFVSDVGVTASFGLTELYGHSDVDAVVRATQQGLHVSKAIGKNRVSVAEGSTAPR